MIKDFVALDLETTGTSPSSDRIIEIGAVRFRDGVPADTMSTLVNPMLGIPPRITQITGIGDMDVDGAPVIGDLIVELVEFTRDLPLLGHNIQFDYGFVKKAAMDAGLAYERSGIDTLKLARRILPREMKKSLSQLCAYFGINPGNSHRALDDAISAARLYESLYGINPGDEGFVKPLPLMCSIKKESPITPAQRSYLSSLLKKSHMSLDSPIDELTKSQASRLIDTILSGGGSR
jgi:DNA polymerase-3 subunit alpha (Gram-positive type)